MCGRERLSENFNSNKKKNKKLIDPTMVEFA